MLMSTQEDLGFSRGGGGGGAEFQKILEKFDELFFKVDQIEKKNWLKNSTSK